MKHLISEIDLRSALEEQYTLCSCGETITVGVFLTLEYAWNDHRGEPIAHGVRHAERATDRDIADFFRKLDDPEYRAPSPTYPAALVTERDGETVEYLLQRLLDEHWPREIYDCGVCRSLNKFDARQRSA